MSRGNPPLRVKFLAGKDNNNDVSLYLSCVFSSHLGNFKH